MTWSLAAVLVGIMVGAAGFACGSNEEIEQNTPAGGEVSSANLASMQRVTETSGWVLTAEGSLLTTRDRGESWTDVTPPEAPASTIRAITFADPDHGWVAFGESTADPGELGVSVAFTADGGETWRTSRVASATVDDNLSPTGPAYLDFVDEKRGWLVWKQVTSSQFSNGHLYRTSDGGITWQKLTIPLGEPVSFANQNEGFVVGGLTGSAAFVTHDGGESWEPLDLQLPPQYADEFVTFGAPTFFADGQGILPATVVGPPTGFGHFTTKDSGLTWEFARATDVAGNVGPGISMPSDAVGPGIVITAEIGGGKVRSIAEEDQDWSIISPNGLPASVFDIDFVDESTGWALVISMQCEQVTEKSGCPTVGRVFKTTDGGQTWSELSPG